MSELPATRLLPLPGAGRRFSAARTVRLGDVDPSGELRLDAIARYLQDVASDDATDAGLSNALGWVVRRTMIRIDRPTSVGEPLSLVTFCSGTGRSWAERRTTIADQHGSAVEAVSVWVQSIPPPADRRDSATTSPGSTAKQQADGSCRRSCRSRVAPRTHR